MPETVCCVKELEQRQRAMGPIQAFLPIIFTWFFFTSCSDDGGGSDEQNSGAYQANTLVISVEGQLDTSEFDPAVTGEEGFQLAERDVVVVVVDEKGLRSSQNEDQCGGRV